MKGAGSLAPLTPSHLYSSTLHVYIYPISWHMEIEKILKNMWACGQCQAPDDRMVQLNITVATLIFLSSSPVLLGASSSRDADITLLITDPDSVIWTFSLQIASTTTIHSFTSWDLGWNPITKAFADTNLFSPLAHPSQLFKLLKYWYHPASVKIILMKMKMMVVLLLSVILSTVKVKGK